MTRFSFVIAIPLLTVLLMVVTAAVRPAVSQTMMLPERIPGDTVVTAVVPAAAYASDVGLVGAVAVSRFRYHPLASPFVSLTEIRLQASTKAYLDLRVLYEHTETFGRPIRSRWVMRAERHPYDNYFGTGNRSEFNREQWNDRYYFYDVMRIGFTWNGRKTLFRPEASRATLDLTAIAGIRYEQPVQNEENLINDEMPVGITGGWTNRVGLGVIWENRDSEFAASRGNRFELSGTWAPRFLLADYPTGLIEADVRQFYTLPVPWLSPVLALRAAGAHSFGTVPYWDLPYLGDEYTLRGFPTYRFRGDSKLFYNIELRTWLYENPYMDFKFGVHAFHDGGRVFTGEDSARDLIRDYHRTFGGGVAAALFTPDFILRFDVGFSEDMFRLYMNIGYMF